MKKWGLIFLAVVCLLPFSSFSYGIVNNAGDLPADSISIPFYAIDSAGNVVDMAANDSVFIAIFYPSGALAYCDTLAYNGAKITAVVFSGGTYYSWKEAVADIDGTPVNGAYSYILTVEDNTDAALRTPHKGHFQLYTGHDFDDLYDTLYAGYDSLLLVQDSVNGIIDTLQNQDNWGATSANQTLIIDTVNGIMDSLQLQDGWIATSANQTIIIDSLYATLDSIQALYTYTMDSLQAILDTLQSDSLEVNVKYVDHSATAAQRLSDIFDGTGAPVTFGQVTITGADTGMVITGTGAAPAIYIEGGATGSGFEIFGGGTSGDAFVLTATNGDGMVATGAGAGNYDILADIAGSVDTITKDVSVGSAEMVLISDTILSRLIDSIAKGYLVIKDTNITGETLAVMPSEWVAADSAGYQGSAAGLDSAAVYGAMAQCVSDSLATLDTLGYLTWANIDTSAIDSSDIIAWFLNNGGSDSTTVNKACTDAVSGVAEEVMDSLLALVEGDTVTGTIMAEIVKASDTSLWAQPKDMWVAIDTTTTVDTSKLGKWFINNVGAGASDTANIWDALVRGGMVTYSGSDSVLKLRSLHILGTTDGDTAFYARAYQSGTGIGFLAQGGNSNSPGMKVVGGAAGGHGAYFQGAGAGSGLYGVGGTSGNGIYGKGSLNGSGGRFESGPSSGDGLFVYSSSGTGFNVSTGGSVAAARISGMFQITGDMKIGDSLVVGDDIVCDSLHGIITGVDSVRNSIVARDTTSAGDSLAVMPNDWLAADSAGYQGAAASVTLAGIYDTIGQLLDDTLPHIAVVPSDTNALGDTLAVKKDSSIYQGAANSLTATMCADSVAAMMNDSAFARVDSTQGWKITRLETDTIEANIKGNIVGSLSGTVTANMSQISGDATAANNLEAALDGTGGITLSLGHLSISGTNGNSGSAYIFNSDGPGMVVVGQGDTDFVGNITGAIDTVRNAGSGTTDTTTMKAMATNNPGLFYGPTATGSGIYTHYIKVIDTSDNTTPDSVLAYILLSVDNASGSNVGSGKSDALGYETFSLDSGSYTFKFFHPEYQADEVTDTVTASGDTTVIRAYDTHTTNTCRVWGYIINPSGDSLNLAYVRFEVPTVNRASDSAIILSGQIVEARTNTNGYFSKDLIVSSLLNDQEYKVTIGCYGYSDKITSITVPDSTTYKLHFGLE